MKREEFDALQIEKGKHIQDQRDEYVELAIKIQELKDEIDPLFDAIKAHQIALNGEKSFTILSRTGSYVTVNKGMTRIGWIAKTGRKAFIKHIMHDPKVLAWFDEQQKESAGAWVKKTVFNIDK